MGRFVNPDNSAFQVALNSRIYVDKTELLNELNSRLSTDDKCIAVSHARRFGKSHAAGMIDAYYSRGCDSAELFENTKLATNPAYKKHMNKYNVIHLDISSFWDDYKANIIEKIKEYVVSDLRDEFEENVDFSKKFSVILMSVYKLTGIQFVIIIDEWDCVIRNGGNKTLVHSYLQFLHLLFKSEESKTFLALAYITGILPIKKIKDESALNNFREFTMLKSKQLTRYFGFTEDEVKKLCITYDMDFESIKAWYNGYLIDGLHMYNPNSVVQAMLDHDYDFYWKNTSSFESINTFITMNYAGLKDDVLAMLSGDKIRVNVNTFQNDLTTVASKDDALTALIHLGYLAYDANKKMAYIPNYEVAAAYDLALQTGSWSEVANSISKCDELLDATLNEDADKVAELVEIAHETYTSVLKYNDENSLSCALTMAYFTANAYYNIVREFPAGKGFADLVFIPRANACGRPAIVIELKYNASADSAISQIKNRRYHGALSGYSNQILLVGINYSNTSDNKKHTCIIESINNLD